MKFSIKIKSLIAFLLFVTVINSDLTAQTTVNSTHLILKSKNLKESKIQEILPIKKGDTIDEESLQTALRKLKETNLFKTVEIIPKTSGSFTDLTYKLTEAHLLRKVKISGNYPFESKKIIRLTTLLSGEPYHEEEIPRSIRRIKAFYEKYGYYDTKVSIIPFFEEDEQVANIHIVIEKGETYSLGEIYIVGNNFFSEKYLKNKIKGFSHFKISKIKPRLQNIQKAYAKKGFVRARVRLINHELNKLTQKVDVHINIQERKRLHLDFIGNKHFRDATLKQIVSFYKERGYDRFATQRSYEKIVSFYTYNGFLKAKIDYEIQKEENDIFITYTIEEGPKIKIKDFVFEGNKELGDSKIEDALSSKKSSFSYSGVFHENYLPDDLKHVVDLYHSEGFFDVELSPWNTTFNEFSDRVVLGLTINENQPYLVDSITFNGNKNIEDDELLKEVSLKTSKRFELKKLLKSVEKITQLYRKKGYAYIKVDHLKIFDEKNKLVSIDFQIVEYTPVVIKNIIIHGNYLTDEKVIKDSLKINEGDFYQYKDVLDAQLNLKRLGIFDHVRIIALGLEQLHDEVDLVVNVQERKSITVDLQAGFDSDKLASGQLLFTKRNIFGSAKQFQTRLVGGFEYSRAEMTLFSTRIFGASWNLANQYFIEYEDDENFNASSFGGSLSTLKPYGNRWLLFLKAGATRFNIIESESNQQALIDNLFDNTFLELSAQMTFDSRDNFADPQRGIYALLGTEFDTDLADVSNNFNITNFNVTHFFGFWNRFTLINTFRMGKLFRISQSPQIPAQKLFFMGGNDTVRGFDEDAIDASGGTTSLLYNVELHFRIFDAFKLAGFFDAGSLTETFSEISHDTIRESAGIGLRYITPVGPIRADYGFVLDKRAGESGSRFHFSFGYFF